LGTASIVFFTDEDAKINKREIGLLDEYKRLEDDWDLEGSKPPAQSAIILAEI